MRPIPWPSGSSRGLSRAPLPVLRLMRVTLIATIPSGTRGLFLLAKAVDYAELFIYDEAQQEAALSDIAILGALPRKCLLLPLPQTARGGDPRAPRGLWAHPFLGVCAPHVALRASLPLFRFSRLCHVRGLLP